MRNKYVINVNGYFSNRIHNDTMEMNPIKNMSYKSSKISTHFHSCFYLQRTEMCIAGICGFILLSTSTLINTILDSKGCFLKMSKMNSVEHWIRIYIT